MKTVIVNNKAQPQWYLVDATDKAPGVIATVIATYLRGKQKPSWSPHIPSRDGVIVINADKIRLSGAKWQDKKYYSHSGYSGGLKTTTADKLHQKKPTEILRHCIAGMIPKNRLKKDALSRLRLFTGAEHNLEAQQPIQLSV